MFLSYFNTFTIDPFSFNYKSCGKIYPKFCRELRDKST